jgi:hypothetical protein
MIYRSEIKDEEYCEVRITRISNGYILSIIGWHTEYDSSGLGWCQDCGTFHSLPVECPYQEGDNDTFFGNVSELITRMESLGFKGFDISDLE